MKRRLISALFAATLALTTMCGISVSAEELTFWHVNAEGNDLDVVNAVIDKFNSTTESGYTVVGVPTQNDAYKEKLVIAMSSGECPDMYISWSGGPMNEYIESGFAQPITEQFNNTELPEKLMQGSIAQSSYKDEIYAVPFNGITVSGIYYNKTIFEDLGIEVPTTIGELEAACDTLVENGIVPFALANSTKWTGSMYFMNLAARYGGLEPFQKAVSGEGSFEDECFLWAGEKIQEWVEKGYFPEGVNSLSEDDGQARQLLYTGEAAMTCIGSWYTSTIKNDSEEFFSENIGWFKFPAYEDAPDVDDSILIGTVGDNFISFNCEGEALDAAVEFASMFADDDMVAFAAERGRLRPVNNIMDYVEDPVDQEIMAAVSGASAIQLWYDQYLPPAVANAHLDGLQEVFGLTKTPAEAQAMMQEAMEAYNAEAAE
ncbi:MAG: extracellular solute-binding protein [Blautia sp.]|nr:extracellular solute-binding protein [Blautia sp.]MDY5031250.1 extracellular solute-binding protein [Blautia sp.]